jgi:hypothetical protein
MAWVKGCGELSEVCQDSGCQGAAPDQAPLFASEGPIWVAEISPPSIKARVRCTTAAPPHLRLFEPSPLSLRLQFQCRSIYVSNFFATISQRNANVIRRVACNHHSHCSSNIVAGSLKQVWSNAYSRTHCCSQSDVWRSVGAPNLLPRQFLNAPAQSGI